MNKTPKRLGDLNKKQLLKRLIKSCDVLIDRNRTIYETENWIRQKHHELKQF